jgi:hypothetical protein
MPDQTVTIAVAGHSSFGTWRDLKRHPSGRGRRRFYWPRPYVLRGDDAVALARQQIVEGYRGTPDDPPILLKSPMEWGENPLRSKPWMTRLMCLQPADAFIYAYEASGDFQWLELFRRCVLDWTDYFMTKEKKAYQAWCDMAVGYRAAKIAYLMALALEGDAPLSDVEGAALVRAALRHIKLLTDESKISSGNHGVFQIVGLAQLSAVFSNYPGKAAVDGFVRIQIRRLVERQFNDEGMHLEHSPHYHWWMADEIRKIIESGWIDGIDFVMTRLDLAEEAKNWLVDAKGRMLKLGDTGSEGRMPMAAPLRPDHETAQVRLRVFPETGYAIARTDEGVLFLNAAYHSRAHKHADDLHLDWHAHGRPILVDGGTSGYKMDRTRQYLLGTRAHNTIQCGDENYPRDGSDAFGSALRHVSHYADGLVVMAANVVHASLHFAHWRKILLLPGCALRIVDRVQTERPRVFRQWLHFHPDWIQSSVGACATELFNNELRIRVAFAGPGAARSIRGEDRDGQLNGWRTSARTLVPAQSYCVSAHGANLTFVATLWFGDTEEPEFDLLPRGAPTWRWER